ncbi:glycosyltransferase [Pseudorhodoplanes sp.]|uniref:glycosyltransferase n=1 Tax=Pseudorhodoplanes sp. TaxID=1934341 RepID=UPI003D145062
MPASVVYISYDGMLEPLGQSQVLAYLEQLSDDYRIRVISYEKKHDWRDRRKVEALKQRLEASRIAWTPLSYHKSPSALATAWDILVGMAVVLWYAIRERASILHVRSYVPALMALPARRLTGTRLLFDIRGFWADERVDGGVWPRDGWLYRLTKKLERRFFLAADHTVTLTRASEAIIRNFDYLRGRTPPISVIPTCADLDRFRPQTVDPNRPFTFGYVGSIGTWYLFDETMSFFRALLEIEPDARFVIVNRHEHELVRSLAKRHGIDERRIEVGGAEHGDMPARIAEMHAAAALIKPCYSKLASAPTKLAEYLGCGVPCLGNTGVGDMDDILRKRGTGVIIEGFSDGELAEAARQIVALARDPETARRCCETAVEFFSLDAGVSAYRRIYQGLA